MTDINTILSELEQYKDGLIDIDFKDVYVYVSEIEKLKIDELSSREKYNVATSKLVASGLLKIYEFLSSVDIERNRRMLVEMLSDLAIPSSFREVSSPLGKMSSSNNVKIRIYIHSELDAMVRRLADSALVTGSHLYRMCICAGLISSGAVDGRYKEELKGVVKDFIDNLYRFSAILLSTSISVYEVYKEKLSDSVREKFEKYLLEEYPEIAGSGRYVRWQLYKVDEVLKYESIRISRGIKMRHSDYVNKAIAVFNTLQYRKEMLERAIEELNEW